MSQRTGLLSCLIAASVLSFGCGGQHGPKATASNETGGTGVKLEWDAAAPGTVTGYYVYYRTDGQKMDPSRRVDAGINNSVTIPNLQRKTKYFFQVSAYNKAGESAPSNETSKTTP